MKGAFNVSIISTLRASKFLDSDAISLVARTYREASKEEKELIRSEIRTEKQAYLSDTAITGGLFFVTSGFLYALDFRTVAILPAAFSIVEAAGFVRCQMHYKLIEKLCKD